MIRDLKRRLDRLIPAEPEELHITIRRFSLDEADEPEGKFLSPDGRTRIFVRQESAREFLKRQEEQLASRKDQL